MSRASATFVISSSLSFFSRNILHCIFIICILNLDYCFIFKYRNRVHKILAHISPIYLIANQRTKIKQFISTKRLNSTQYINVIVDLLFYLLFIREKKNYLVTMILYSLAFFGYKLKLFIFSSLFSPS